MGSGKISSEMLASFLKIKEKIQEGWKFYGKVKKYLC